MRPLLYYTLSFLKNLITIVLMVIGWELSNKSIEYFSKGEAIVGLALLTCSILSYTSGLLVGQLRLNSSDND